MTLLHDITIGADPELFCFDETTKEYVSAHTFLVGTKDEPFPVTLGAVQVDGTAAEFNIEPAKSQKDFIRNINSVMHQLQQMVPDGVSLQPVPFVEYDPVYFTDLPYECQMLGCDPDFNAWQRGRENPTPIVEDSVRVAGGHIHIGWTKDATPDDFLHRNICNQVVRQLDYMLGLYSFVWDSDTKRRAVYGKAGACRYKPYGVEYRTLSNAWLKDQRTIELVYQQTMKAISLINEGIFLENIYGNSAEQIINSGDKKAALTIIEEINKESFRAVS
jgi:hypothetical protein